MSSTERIAIKAARQMADILVKALGEVDEVVIGTPGELARPLLPVAVIKTHVRLGTTFREHLPLPISIAARVVDHLVATVVPETSASRRRAHEDIESAVLNLLDGADTRRYAQDRPVRITGTYAFGSETSTRVVLAWYSDNTLRIGKPAE